MPVIYSFFPRKHFFYVLFCQNHPFKTKFVARGDYTFDIKEKCACKDGRCHKVCGFCFSVRYHLNFKCYKIRVDEVPDYFIERVFPLDTYLKKINCDLFFFLVVRQNLLR